MMIVLCVRAHDIVGGCGALTLAHQLRVRRQRSMRKKGRREMMWILHCNRAIVVKRFGTIFNYPVYRSRNRREMFLGTRRMATGKGQGRLSLGRRQCRSFSFSRRILSASRFFVQVFATSCPQSGKMRSFFALKGRIRGVVTRNSEKYRESFPQFFPLYPQRRFCT